MRIIFLLLFSTSIFANDVLELKIDKVYDGDTAMVTMPNMPPSLAQFSIRLSGIDAPELKSKCILEHQLASNAKEELQKMIDKKTVQLYNCQHDKYGGRIDCEVFVNGVNVNKQMLDKKLVVPYNGGKKVTNWCK